MNITEAFSQYGNYQMVPSYVYWIAALIIIVTAGLYLLKVYSQKKIEQMAIFARFQSYAKECNIDGQLWEVLLTIVQAQQLPDPIRILKNAEEYDNSSSAFLKSVLEKGLKAGEYEDLLIHITKIRERVTAKAKEQFKPIESTADLYSGLDLQIEVTTGNYIGSYESTVASASNNNLVIHSPTINQRKLFFSPNDKMTITFARESDAVYQFDTVVIGKYQGSLSAIMLQNTNKIRVQHIRKYNRVNPNFPIKMIGTSTPGGDIHVIENLKSEKVSIADISGGGLQIQINQNGNLKNYLEKSKILVFSIYIPEIGPVEELKGRILRYDPIKGKDYIICSLEFFNMTSKTRCRLLQGILVFLSKSK